MSSVAIDDRYRTLWRRFAAALIDVLVIVPLIGLQGAVLESRLPASLKACLSAAIIVCGYAYSIVMHWRFGATLGKMAIGIRVLDLGETPLSLRQALVREAINIALGAYSNVTYLALIASGQPLPVPTGALDPNAWVSLAVFGLEIATALFNRKRRSLHDLIAGTVVVRESSRVIAPGLAGNADPPGRRPIPPT
jgi:uncharacterized RDD family membrane protein YckC